MSVNSERADKSSRVRILHVDDVSEFGDLVKAFLEREREVFEVVTETRARDGIARLKSGDIDCIVSDYEMPELNGLEFLEIVRGPHPDMPFILFTGKGSEEIASEAISRGVTDYLQKGSGTDQYEVLSNRILNSVQSYRTEHELERSRAFLDRVLDLSPSAVVVLDGEGGIIRSNKPAETMLGVTKAEMGKRTFDDAAWEIVDKDGVVVPDDALPFRRVVDTGKPVYDVEHGLRRPDGEIIWLSINAAPLHEGTESTDQVVAVLSDQSNRKRRDQQQAETIRQLEGLGHVLSHDLGNALQIASGRLDLALETEDSDQFRKVGESLERAIDILNDLSDSISAGTVVEEVTTADVGVVFDRAWSTQKTDSATKEVEPGIQIQANEMALLRAFENLIRNTIEHGVDTATIRVGSLRNGFFVEDDGPGIPEADRKRVFEPGFTSKEDGTGIGLPSVQQVALAHRWDVEITESKEGGARFEFTNVTLLPA